MSFLPHREFNFWEAVREVSHHLNKTEDEVI